MKRLVVVGQGYVGLPLSMRGVQMGFDVVGYDVDAKRVAFLNAGESYVEDISDAELMSARETGRFVATLDSGDLADFDFAIVTVPTPLQEGVPDLSYIEVASAQLGRHLNMGATVVLESTTYPGTTEELVGPILEEASGLKAGVDFSLGYSPERIDPGNKTWTLVNTPKVVSGINAESLEAVKSLYDVLVDRTVPVSSLKEAELTKLLENTFRHVNIALVNELAMFAHDLGINVWESIDAASTKPFGYMRFTPGPGVGGHCLPIDPSYLAWRVERSLGRSFRFVELANDVNEHMPHYVVRRVVEALNERERSVRGTKILVLGLAYKRNTGDAREAPSTSVIEQLVTMGAAVSVADPHVSLSSIDALVDRVEVTEASVRAADLVIVLVNHDAFDLHMVGREAQTVLDTCAAMPAGTAQVL